MLRVAVVLVVLTSHLAEFRSWNNGAVRKVSYMDIPIPNCNCRHSICKNASNYPKEEIERAMEEQHSLKSLLRGTLFNATTEIMVVSNRDFESDANLTKLCYSDGPITYSPETMRNWNGQCKFIVNTDKYQQTFTGDSCRSRSTDKKDRSGDLCSSTFNMNCSQNYQSLSLLIYENNTIQFDKFRIPTACKCCTD